MFPNLTKNKLMLNLYCSNWDKHISKQEWERGLQSVRLSEEYLAALVIFILVNLR
jgi:hypothetical protein